MRHQLALITGASSGIGRSLCYLLANQGINLIVSGRSTDQLKQLQEALSDKVQVQAVTCDLAIKEERVLLTEVIHERCPDLVVNNAGFGLYGEALTYSTSEQMSILEVNGNAVLEITLEAARTLISRNAYGVILNVSSAGAFQVFPTLAVYAAAKAFVNHLSQSLDEEFRSNGVRVLAACPGMVNTPFQTKAGGNGLVRQSCTTMSAEKVAGLIWDQILNPIPLVIMDWKYRMMTALSKLIPQAWLTAMLRKNILSRIQPRKIKKIE